MTTEKPTGLALLRAPFPENQISKLPKPIKRDAVKGKCQECGGYHGLPAVHLDYVGHAALTARLLDSDPQWTWEPLALDSHGLPAIDASGGMWIRLTVCGVTRLGYGDAQGKTGPDAMKERIGDALRNAAMRFGAALELWHKGDLYTDEDEPRRDERKPDQRPTERDDSPQATSKRITEGVAKGDASGAAMAMSEWPQAKLDAVWELLSTEVQAKINAAWPKETA